MLESVLGCGLSMGWSLCESESVSHVWVNRGGGFAIFGLIEIIE